jgi:hypothetical protein
MKREEILALCASNPEVIAYILSLESQIKEDRNLTVPLKFPVPPRTL